MSSSTLILQFFAGGKGGFFCQNPDQLTIYLGLNETEESIECCAKLTDHPYPPLLIFTPNEDASAWILRLGQCGAGTKHCVTATGSSCFYPSSSSQLVLAPGLYTILTGAPYGLPAQWQASYQYVIGNGPLTTITTNNHRILLPQPVASSAHGSSAYGIGAGYHASSSLACMPKWLYYVLIAALVVLLLVVLGFAVKCSRPRGSWGA